MALQKLSQYLAEASKNRKQRAHTDCYQIIRNDEEYFALVVDAWYDKEKGEIVVCFIVFVSLAGVRREIKFKTNSAGVHFYEEICETLGTDGNPCDLIGKAVYLHFEKNGEFQNVRVDALMSNEELQEKLEEMEGIEARPKKKSKKSSPSKTQKKQFHKEAYVREETDDFDEEEESTDDFDEDINTENDSDYDDDFDEFD